MSNTCENCIFWYKPFEGAFSGECRIDPPKVMATNFGIHSQFPKATNIQWCGKFQPKTEQVNYEVSVGE